MATPTSIAENAALRASRSYPFDLAGPLCPLLNDRDTLAAFYSEAGFRQSIKQFCKRVLWKGKPAVSFAVDPEKLKELLQNLYNSPEAREKLRTQSVGGHCRYLHDAIWQWFGTENPELCQALSEGCTEVKDRLFLTPAALEEFLGKVREQKPGPASVKQLAFVVLAFAILQPDDRFALGDVFVAAFPEYVAAFGG